ncbi:MAG: tetratricopeptide repeat protein [Acidobacteriota bacterium]|nr:tetratricopeptide repeat protein [Acidobacteriota bacterium]
MVSKIGIRALAALAFTVAAAGAQDWMGGKGRLEGVVRDPQGKPVAGATVALRRDGKGPDLKTDKNGKWVLLGLADGSWQVEITAAGFEGRREAVVLGGGARAKPFETQLAPAAGPAEAAHEEIRVDGKTIRKETADPLERANAAMQAKQYGVARENYAIALTELPDNVQVLTRLALASYADQKFDEALEHSRRIVAKDPGATGSWLMIAELELKNGRFEEGKQALERVPEDRITDPQPYLNLGIISYNKKRTADAEAYFTRAIEKKPNLADAYYFRGLARLQAKQHATARTDLEKYLSLAPSGENAETAKELLKTLR